MARVGFEDPIFRSDGGELQFTARMHDPEGFQSELPGLTFFDALQVDPGLEGGMTYSWDGGTLMHLGDEVDGALENRGNRSVSQVLGELAQSSGTGVIAFLQDAGAKDVVRSLRGIVGQLAVTVGFTPIAMSTSVRGLYRSPLRNVVMGLEIANRIINSEYFQQAMDGITMIPIIGWIVRVLMDVLKLVMNIVSAVKKKRLDKMNFELARMFHLPLMRADRDMQVQYNQTMVRYIMRQVASYRSWTVFQPPYIIPDGSGEAFETVAAADPDGSKLEVPGPNITLTQGWYMRGVEGLPGGVGFMPGGNTIFRALEFSPSTGGPRNIGNYASTARQTAGALWQVALQPGPAMFALNTQDTRRNWDNYVHGMLEYGERCVLMGFTTSETSVQTTHKYGDCSDREFYLTDKPYDTDVGVDKKKRTRRLKGGWDGYQHFEIMLLWIAREFWGRGPDQTDFPYPVRDATKDFNSDDFFYDNTIYAHSIKNMYDRQKSAAQGYEAFSVFPGMEFFDDTATHSVIHQPAGVFPAFGRSGHWNRPLIKRWEDTITAVLADKALWQYIPWRSVPQYTWAGQSVREILKARQGGGGMGYIAPHGTAPPLPGPSMFPPPAPPGLVGGARDTLDLDVAGERAPARTPMPTASKAMFAAAAAMGAVVGANELYRMVRRRYFT